MADCMRIVLFDRKLMNASGIDAARICHMETAVIY